MHTHQTITEAKCQGFGPQENYHHHHHHDDYDYYYYYYYIQMTFEILMPVAIICVVCDD